MDIKTHGCGDIANESVLVTPAVSPIESPIQLVTEVISPALRPPELQFDNRVPRFTKRGAVSPFPIRLHAIIPNQVHE